MAINGAMINDTRFHNYLLSNWNLEKRGVKIGIVDQDAIELQENVWLFELAHVTDIYVVWQ